ncbi:hypothetical protein [Mycobacterium sp. DL592]|uniref:hypothetical protein n=1 Tax=Mycobacterium sp. DL592 TaxID=2675524 RepID=UPI001423821B|nr:hypothetical protein [Mycobacterium sp. DL592]
MSGTGWTRLITVVAGGATLVAVGSAAVGCSRDVKEPAPSSTSSSPGPAPSPVEKGIINMPPKAFNQNQNAADALLALQSQGYIVQINNGEGYSGNSVLSSCKITSVDGYKGGNPPPSTTVYLTLSCPNSNN